jgi:hypothetical protein
MAWKWREGGKEMSDSHDPGVSSNRRTEVFFLGLLPIEGLL